MRKRNPYDVLYGSSSSKYKPITRKSVGIPQARNRNTAGARFRGWMRKPLWAKGQVHVHWKIIGISIFLIFLASGLFHGLGISPVNAAPPGFNSFSHTRTTLLGLPSSFGSGTGAALNNWNFNYTNTPTRTDICVGLQSSNQLRFKYDQGKLATSYGPFEFAATDTGNGIDLQQQQKIFYTQGRWWVFFINSTGGAAHQIIYTSSKSGSNATGSWDAGGTFVTGYGGSRVAGIGQFVGQHYGRLNAYGAAASYVVFNNATTVDLFYLSSVVGGNQLRVRQGTLNTDGTITVTAAGDAGVVTTPNASVVISNPNVVEYSTSPNVAIVTYSWANVTAGQLPNDQRIAYSTGGSRTVWSSQVVHSAAGGQISHTAWYSFDADMLNGSMYLAYSSSNGDYAGVQGTFGIIFTRPSTLGAEETIANSNNVAWFPYGITGVASNDIVAAFVNGTGSNLNQIFLFNERINGVWKYANNVLWPNQAVSGVPTTYDLSSGAIWDSSHATYYYINQLTTKEGISGWWNSTTSTNSNTWTNKPVNFKTNSNMTSFFPMVSPTDGNVSSRYNRMNQDIKTVTVTDGNVRAGTFWTEGNGAAPVDANAYRLVFGSILMPQGKPQYGNNCNSADVAIYKTPVNLQAGSGKQLEFFFSSDCPSPGSGNGCLGSLPDFSSIEFDLRTNSTLPNFTEGYVPQNDPAVRFIMRLSQSSNGTFSQSIYTAKGANAAISQEQDLVTCVTIWGTSCTAGNNPFFGCPAGTNVLLGQLILNYTGPNNELNMEEDCTGGTGLSTVGVQFTGVQGQLQQGQDYYLTVKVSWGLALDPAAGEFVDFRVNDGGSATGCAGATPCFPGAKSGSIYSIPASCSDPKNNANANCFAAAVAPTPTFNINPLDPSSWANAIIKGLEWVFTIVFTVVGQMFGYVAPLIIGALDNVGRFLGLGNIGTQISNLFATVAGAITNIFGNFFTWAVSLVTLIGNAFNTLAELLGTYFTQIGTFFTGLFGFMGFLWTVVSDVLQFGKFPVAFTITMWWVWGMFAAYDDGIAGFIVWVDMSEVVMFKGLNVVIWFGEETFKMIARLRTILPRPFGV